MVLPDKKEMGIGFIKQVGTALFLAGVVWGTLKGVPAQQKINTANIAENKTKISLVEKDVSYTRAGVERIENFMLHRRNGGRHGQ